MTASLEAFAASRGRLLGLAYRMLGSRADAEDILQDAYLRYQALDPAEVRNAEALLVTTVTRLCLDRLKSARRQREVYVGPWLPEPVLDGDQLSPETAAEVADDLSFALLLTLEKLSAPERAAFLLHDVFETPFAQVAETLGKSEAACRQLAARARKAVRSEKPAQPVSPEAHRALAQRFAEAVMTGDASRLEALLAADAVAYTDGGGVKIAALNPIRGASKIARFIASVVSKNLAPPRGTRFQAAAINGAPGFLVYLDGELEQTMSLDVSGDRITAIYVVRNPRKLETLETATEKTMN